MSPGLLWFAWLTIGLCGVVAMAAFLYVLSLGRSRPTPREER